MALTLTAMRGYPASGKSTLARQIADETGAVVVCRDELRNMLHGTYWSGKRELEDQVTIAERAQVKAFLMAGVSVVVDATHLEPSYLRKWAKLSRQLGADFKRVDVPTPPLECVDNDCSRSNRTTPNRYVGADVIKRAAKRHPIEKWPNIQAPPAFTPVQVEWIDGLPEAIIVDIDGTLAHMTGRSPYDYSQVHTDVADEQVRWLVNMLYGSSSRADGHESLNVLIVSGRDDSCRESTEEWLWEHGISYDELHMRPTGAVDELGNKLPDYQVKYDLFDKHIRGNYNIRFVLDDRDQVVKLWRDMGLKCLQVQPGDF